MNVNITGGFNNYIELTEDNKMNSDYGVGEGGDRADYIENLLYGSAHQPSDDEFRPKSCVCKAFQLTLTIIQAIG